MHGAILIIFVSIKVSNTDNNTYLLAYQGVYISNDLYRDDTLSEFEIAKGI